MNKPGHCDLFCTVIDNFGDIGVCWRLAGDLASRGWHVRLWVDDASALTWMAPTGHANVQVLAWTAPLDLQAAALQTYPVDVVVEAFGCEIPPEFLAACVAQQPASTSPLWINLEYLTAEPYAERSHGLPSPVQTGPAAGWRKWFFYPGFTAKTGGVLREADVPERQAAFDRAAWLQGAGIDWQGESLVSLFCYEPPALAGLLQRLRADGLAQRPVRLLVAAGRATQAVKTALQSDEAAQGLLSIHYLPLLTQTDFDHLLWACDLNFVRGEDSVVRALWAGQPFVWQIYPQDDGVHHAKLDAFLDVMAAPPSLRAFHHHWNAATATDALPDIDLSGWRDAALGARQALLAQDDLTSRLLGFIEKNR